MDQMYVPGLASSPGPAIDDDVSSRSRSTAAGPQREADGLALQRPKDPQSCRTIGLRKSGSNRSARAATRRRPPSCRAQPFGRQFLGLGASIRLTASAGTSDTTTVTKSTLPSLRTTCTSPPESTKPDPAGTTCGVQLRSLAR